MSQLPVDAGVNLPRLAPNHRLQAVVDGALARLGDVPEPLGSGPFLPADFFGLPQVQAFRSLDGAAQDRVVAACSRQLLEEAWHIERIGLAFVAKMVLLAPSAEERVLYGLFGADEARHLVMIDALLGQPSSVAPSAFHELLAEVVEHGDRATLVLVVQVVLEGWGLAHYRSMAQATTEPALERVLRGILRDEVLHHASGLAVFPELPFDSDSRSQMVGVLERFLRLVRMGPQGVVAALASELPDLDRRRAFEELDTEGHSATRLMALRALLLKVGAEETVARLTASGAFDPATAEECA